MLGRDNGSHGASNLPQDAVRRQIASSIEIMIHLSRLRDHSRRVIGITEVAGYRNGEIRLNPLFVFEEPVRALRRE